MGILFLCVYNMDTLVDTTLSFVMNITHPNVVVSGSYLRKRKPHGQSSFNWAYTYCKPLLANSFICNGLVACCGGVDIARIKKSD